MKIGDIVRRYILENKKNTILIIVSIIISTALFLFMNILSEDARNLMVDQAKKEMGTNHASYYDPTGEDIEYFKNNPNIEKVGTSMLLGIHDIGNSQTLHILSEDKNSQELKESYKIQNGSFPVNENEIVVDKWYIEQKNIKNPIGKTIRLDYKKSNENGDILYDGDMEFKITGILNSNTALKAQGTSIGLISQETARKNIPTKNKYDQAVIKLKKEKNIQKQIENIIKEGNLINNNVRLNNQLILAMSDSISLKIPYIIVNIILSLATILLIYNIFYILVSNRTKDFGVLRALGFRPYDVSKIVILEVFIYLAISIPVGILIGGVVANISRENIIGIIYNVSYVNSIKSDNYIGIYIVSVLLSMITIIISVIKPLISLCKIDPIVCMRRNEEKINIKGKSFINKFMTKVFKDYGNIASKNLQRNRKRTNLAIASMSIVIFLITIVYTKSTSNFLNDGGLRLWIPGDYLMHNIDILSTNEDKITYDRDILKDIENIDGVKKVNASRNKAFNIQIDDKNINKDSGYWKENKDILEAQSKIKDGKKIYHNFFEVVGLEDIDILKDVLIDGKDNLNKINDNPYIYIDKKSSEALSIKEGNKIKVNFDIIDSKTNNYKKTLSKEFIVAGTIKNLPIVSQGGGQSFGAVISVNQMNKFIGNSSYERFDIWTSKIANNSHIENELKKIIEKTGKGILIPYKSESAGIEKSDNQKAMIMVLVVGVIIILSLFNCCNTIVTSINSRVREFALLRGIGISKHEIKKIIKLEGLVYILISSSISILPSLIVRSIIIKDFPNINLINLKFIIATIIIYVILSAITMITIEKTLKQVLSEDFVDQIKMLQ
ncbi:ABC transporter permease [Romboutsia weinsteinii]|uniref:ABC transporter permease n=1 Tax=Romboutsia weinsteinii TaxID=2020949 RepID=A0A371J4E3_9FIRM|nr:ABC transporter permease [Romboutsia weinsteinii]RDY27605.1 ABC transporter permease [Romboutsia weinsteinii]